MQIGVIVVILLVTLYAIKQEVKEQKNCYIQGIPDISDTPREIYRKIKYCLEADMKTIKWRRSLLYAVLGTVMLYSIIHGKIPDTKEGILTILVLYSVYYNGWHHHVDTTLKQSAIHGWENARKIRRLPEEKI